MSPLRSTTGRAHEVVLAACVAGCLALGLVPREVEPAPSTSDRVPSATGEAAFATEPPSVPDQ